VKSQPAAPIKPAVKPGQAPTISVALRRYLYVTAGVTGAAIMIVEILGAKMLSPYVGLSHFVWTAQIAVTLIALACGYYLGGRLADRSQQVFRLYWAILGAAAYLSLSVLICAPVAYKCLDLNLAVGSLLASSILFFVPLALLAMTGPFLVRVITSSVEGVGSNVGRLTAISTVGSFAGTMLIGYFMIPFLPNSVTMFLTALALMLICAGYFGLFRRPAVVPLVLILALAIITGFILRHVLSVQPHRMVELFRGNSHFGQLQVFDRADGSKRFYMNDFLIQNTYDPVLKQSLSQFTYMLAGLGRAYTTNIHDVLCIGLGVGIVPMDFAHQGVSVDVVEINPAVVPVAVRYFNLETNKLTITIDDGRHYLNRCKKKYDVVVLDAFLGDSSPSHLLTRQAFDSIRNVLQPGGTLVINAFANLEQGHDFFGASLHNTLKASFQSVRVHSNGDGALFFVASPRATLEFVHKPDLSVVHSEVIADARETYRGTVDTQPEHGLVLTDNYNPAEFYDARNREELRRRLAQSVREM
jgi:spermidine synthase